MSGGSDEIKRELDRYKQTPEAMRLAAAAEAGGLSPAASALASAAGESAPAASGSTTEAGSSEKKTGISEEQKAYENAYNALTLVNDFSADSWNVTVSKIRNLDGAFQRWRDGQRGEKYSYEQLRNSVLSSIKNSIQNELDTISYKGLDEKKSSLETLIPKIPSEYEFGTKKNEAQISLEKIKKEIEVRDRKAVISGLINSKNFDAAHRKIEDERAAGIIDGPSLDTFTNNVTREVEAQYKGKIGTSNDLTTFKTLRDNVEVDYRNGLIDLNTQKNLFEDIDRKANELKTPLKNRLIEQAKKKKDKSEIDSLIDTENLRSKLFTDAEVDELKVEAERQRKAAEDDEKSKKSNKFGSVVNEVKDKLFRKEFIDERNLDQGLLQRILGNQRYDELTDEDKKYILDELKVDWQRRVDLDEAMGDFERDRDKLSTVDDKVEEMVHMRDSILQDGGLDQSIKDVFNEEVEAYIVALREQSQSVDIYEGGIRIPRKELMKRKRLLRAGGIYKRGYGPGQGYKIFPGNDVNIGPFTRPEIGIFSKKYKLESAEQLDEMIKQKDLEVIQQEIKMLSSKELDKVIKRLRAAGKFILPALVLGGIGAGAGALLSQADVVATLSGAAVGAGVGFVGKGIFGGGFTDFRQASLEVKEIEKQILIDKKSLREKLDEQKLQQKLEGVEQTKKTIELRIQELKIRAREYVARIGGNFDQIFAEMQRIAGYEGYKDLLGDLAEYEKMALARV